MLQHCAYEVQAAPPARQRAPLALFDFPSDTVGVLSSPPLAQPAKTPAPMVRIVRRTTPRSDASEFLPMAVWTRSANAVPPL
jgi:hypothetical protein